MSILAENSGQHHSGPRGCWGPFVVPSMNRFWFLSADCPGMLTDSGVTGKMTSNSLSLGLFKGVDSVRRQKCVCHEQQKFISKSNYTPTHGAGWSKGGKQPRTASWLENVITFRRKGAGLAQGREAAPPHMVWRLLLLWVDLPPPLPWHLSPSPPEVTDPLAFSNAFLEFRGVSKYIPLIWGAWSKHIP